MYDCDIFKKLEEQFVSYLSSGKVMLLHVIDMNTRTATRDDFITHDSLDCAILNDVVDLLTYEADIGLPVRNNPDVTVYDFGLKLFV